MPTLYAFESSDSLVQFSIWMVPVAGAGIGGLFFFASGGWPGVLAGLLIGTALIAGLRASIKVTDTETVIVKKWFFVPYRTYRAAAIEDVWFGGDWGLAEGAIGVVVKLNQQEVHIGTSRNMRGLHDALWPLSLSCQAIRDRAKVAISSEGGVAANSVAQPIYIQF